MPVYALIVGAHGPKLGKTKIEEQDCTESAPLGGAGRGIRGDAFDMSDSALYVSNWTDRPVVDHTSLKGLFAVQTEGWGSQSDDVSRPLSSKSSTLSV